MKQTNEMFQVCVRILYGPEFYYGNVCPLRLRRGAYRYFSMLAEVSMLAC